MTFRIRYLLLFLALVSASIANAGVKGFRAELATLQANWSIRYEYDGKVTLKSTSGTRVYNWPTQMSGDQPGMSPSVVTSGKVKAILEWQGSGAAPKSVNIIVNARALAEGMDLMAAVPSARVVNNGYDDPLVEVDSAMWREGAHLKTLAVNNGVATYTHTLSASSSVSGFGTTTASVTFSVQLDPRFVLINLAGYPTNYKRYLTGNLKVYTIQYSNGATENFTYPEAIPVANDFITASDNPLSTGGTMYLGLPMNKRTANANPLGGGVVYDPLNIQKLGLAFEGNVYQMLVPNERYDWESDQGGFASDLPTFLHGWTIRPNNQEYEPPRIETQYSVTMKPDTRTFNGSVGGNGWVRLKYRWQDQVKGQCDIALDFRMDADNIQTIHTYMDFKPTVGWSAVPFDVAWVEDPIPYSVIVQPRNWSLTSRSVGGSIALAALSMIDPPIGIYFSVAAIIYGIAVDTDTGGPVSKNYPAPGLGDLDDADALGHVDPPDWRNRIQPPYNVGDFKWSAEFRPKYHYTHRVVDRWGLAGYLGQEIGVSDVPQDMISSPKRYKFRWKGL